MYTCDYDPKTKNLRMSGRGWGRKRYDNPEFRECRNAILRAFKKLRSQNIRTRANFWCCGSCACAAIDNLDDERKKKGQKPYDGAVFWHRQSEQGLRESGHIYVYFCVDAVDGEDHKPRAKAVAERTVAALKEEGLDVTWEGDTGTAILVDGFTEKYWKDMKDKAEFKEAIHNAFEIDFRAS